MKATSFQINRNLGLGRPGSNRYTNASGPIPDDGEFDLNYFNALIADTRLTASQIKDAAKEAVYFVNEYQRQVDYHNSRGETENATTTTGWLNTAKQVLSELNAKLPATDQVSPTTAPASAAPTAVDANGNLIIAETPFNWTPVFWVGGFLVVGTIATVLIRRSIKKGKNKSTPKPTPATA